MTIGERIRKRREELGYTQDELAKKLGYKSRSSVNKVEMAREIPMKKVKLYADVLDMTVPSLMGWEEPKIVIEMADMDTNLIRMEKRMKEYALKMSKLHEEDRNYIMGMIDRLGK